MRIVLWATGIRKGRAFPQDSEHYGMPVITVSSVMRRAAAESSESGRMAKEGHGHGESHRRIAACPVAYQMPQMDLDKGFILVDLPKNAGQARARQRAERPGRRGGAGVEPRGGYRRLMERLVGRITCDSCGAQYNKYVNPPLVDGCAMPAVRVSCAGRTTSEETISNRLRVYEGQMGPLAVLPAQRQAAPRRCGRGSGKAWKTVRKVIDRMPKRGAIVESDAAPQTVAEATLVVGKAGRRAARDCPVKATTAGRRSLRQRRENWAAVQAKKPAVRKGRLKMPSRYLRRRPRAGRRRVQWLWRRRRTKSGRQRRPAPRKAVAAIPPRQEDGVQETAAKKAVAKKAAATKSASKKAVAKKVQQRKP